MRFQILDNFQMPESRFGGASRKTPKYPEITEIRVGQTIIFADVDRKTRKDIRSFCTCYGDTAKRRFRTRTLIGNQFAIHRLPDNTPKAHYNVASGKMGGGAAHKAREVVAPPPAQTEQLGTREEGPMIWRERNNYQR